MKLFVVAIVLVAGHLVTALDPADLAYGDHIQKHGKLIEGKHINNKKIKIKF